MATTVRLARRSLISSTSAKRRRGFSHGSVAYTMALIDFVIVLACSVVGVFTYHYMAFGVLSDPTMNVGIGLLTAAIFVLAMSCLHAYAYAEFSSVGHQILLICLLIPTVLAFLLAVIFFLKLGETFSRGAILTLATLSIVSLIGIRIVWRRCLSTAASAAWLRPKNAFFICPESMSGDGLQKFTQSAELRIAQVAWFPTADEPMTHLRDRLSTLNGACDIDEIVIVWRDAPEHRLEEMLLELRRLPLPVKVVFDSFTGSIVSCHPESIGSVIGFQVQRPPLYLAERVAKRIFDIAFSLVALVFLSPLFLIIAAAIKIDSAGPVFFLQRRRGHANRQFRIVKFRSMTVMEDGDNIRQATRSDLRVTRVGAFIRASSIDELPQFWNVLRGEMSVVGPRPHAVAHDDVYDRLIEEYASRRHVKPGITGWAQTRGYRGETPTVEAMEQRVLHDLWYMDNWSFWLDIKIVMRTIFTLRGA